MTVAEQVLDFTPLLDYLRGHAHNEVGGTDTSEVTLLRNHGERLALTCRGVVRLVSIHSAFPQPGTMCVARGVPLTDLPAHLRQIVEARA